MASNQQTFSSATPTTPTGFVSGAYRIQIWNTDAVNVADVYINKNATGVAGTPDATVPPGSTVVLEKKATNITALQIASPAAAAIVVCWGYQLAN